MLGIFLAEASYWARDIIFLVTEHEQLGIEAWLEAYHYTSSGANVIDFGQLDARAGSIQVTELFVKFFKFTIFLTILLYEGCH